MTALFSPECAPELRRKARLTASALPMQKRAERAAFRLSHRVIANCLVVQNQLIREGVNPSKIIQHYNGLDLERLKVRAGLRREAALSGFGLRQIVVT